LLLVILMIAVPAAVLPQTDIYLQTERSGRGKIPIVVSDIRSPKANLDKTAKYMTAVLRRDLQYTGVFDPLTFAANADTLADGGTAAAIFEGAIEGTGESLTLEAKLIDYSSREIIFSKRYSFKPNSRRTVAHHVSDEITYFLLGETGIATTRLLFCRREGETKKLYVIDYDGYGERLLVGKELTLSPVWLDPKRFCFTSYRRNNPDCYLVDLKAGKRTYLSHRKGMNVAGSYYAPGDEIAITLSVKGNSEIYVIDSAGKIVRRLTRNRAIDCSPSWAPNGNEIAFVSDRTGSPQIYAMDRFGGNVRRLTRHGSYNTSPSWSPDGDLIAYSSRDGWLYRLKLITPDGLTEETVYDDYLSFEDPVWAPDGRHIAATVKYGRETWIVIVNVETGEKRRLIRGEMAAWSPLPSEGILGP
jgi:TolB protein